MGNKVIVIGGGIAGLTAASTLAGCGVEVVLLEKEEQTGGHVARWDRLFPTLRPAHEVLEKISGSNLARVKIHVNTHIKRIIRNDGQYLIECEERSNLAADAIILATGYELFEAGRKEEYGYGIYDNVITSADLEDMFRAGKGITNMTGKIPARIGLVHCVGSRDEKVGNMYCSKICCVTGVKQAIELRQALPQAEVFSFYMDLRMFARGFEELYFEAQQKWGVHFIRGRVSECAENQDYSVIVKTEDTLTGRPLKITVDLLVLLVGFVPSSETNRIAGMLGLPVGQDRFLLTTDEHTADNSTILPGVFLTGSLKGPSGIVNTIADARATAIQVIQFLEKIKHV
jgi:heterodisulfide reductase subunit A